MKCPHCNAADTKVTDSRPTEDGSKIRRRRECVSCGSRFTTYETMERIPLMVIKKDGSRQIFDRKKLLKGLLRACEKRNVSLEVLEKTIDAIEIDYANRLVKEIESKELGEKVLQHLLLIDDVAYIRFASVYRDFQDIHSFMQELTKLQQRSETENLA